MSFDELLRSFVTLIYYAAGTAIPAALNGCSAERIRYSELDIGALRRQQAAGNYILVITEDPVDCELVEALNKGFSDHFIGCFLSGIPQCDRLIVELQKRGSLNTLHDPAGQQYIISDWNCVRGIARTSDNALMLTDFTAKNVSDDRLTPLTASGNAVPAGMLLPRSYAADQMIGELPAEQLDFSEKLAFLCRVMREHTEDPARTYPDLQGRLVFFRSGAYLAERICGTDFYPTPSHFLYAVLLNEMYTTPARAVQALLDFAVSDDVTVSQMLISELEQAFVFNIPHSARLWSAILMREIVEQQESADAPED